MHNIFTYQYKNNKNSNPHYVMVDNSPRLQPAERATGL